MKYVFLATMTMWEYVRVCESGCIEQTGEYSHRDPSRPAGCVSVLVGARQYVHHLLRCKYHIDPYPQPSVSVEYASIPLDPCG